MDILPLPLQVVEKGSLQLELLLLDVERRHARFFFEDGDLLLVSSSVDFRVHIDRLVQQSTVLESVLAPLTPGLAESQGVIYMSTLDDDPSDWASLLDVIYHNYTTSPTLHELLGILRLSHRYKFTVIRLWSTARLRSEFFPNPEYFHADPINSERAEQKLRDTLNVIALSCNDLIEAPILILAFYAVARRDPKTLPADIVETSHLTWDAWNIVATGRQRMTRGIKRLINTVPDVALVNRPTEVSHCNKTCERTLTLWVSNAEKAYQPDVLQVLRWLQNNMPYGSICCQCMNGALQLLEQQRKEFYRVIPTYFGFREDQGYELDVRQDKLDFLSVNFRP